MQVAKDVLIRSLSLIAFLLLMLAVAYFDSAAMAQTPVTQPPVTLAQIKRVESDKLEQGKRVQQQVEAIDDQRMELANEYRSLVKHNARLEQYNNALRQTIESQQAHVASLQQQIDSVRNLDREIVPLMANMLDTLENFIALDIPFLWEERNARIAELRALLHNGQVTNSEKYRRILEAYQIENDYGRTIEAYDGILPTANGERQTVTFLKVGRIAFLYQTLDGTQSYFWSKPDRAWRRLDGSHNAGVEEGIKMAREQIPPDLMFVPLVAPPISNSAS